MSVTAVMRPLGDEQQTRKPGPASEEDNAPPPTFWEQVTSSFRTTVDDIPNHERDEQNDAYGALVPELVRRGRKPQEFINPGRGGEAVRSDQVWAAIEAERARDPKAFADLPKTRVEFDQKWRARMGQRQQQDQQIVQQSGWTPWLIGTVAGSAMDPVNWLPFGAGKGASFGRRVLVEGLANMGVEAAEQPLINVERQKQGRPEMTPGERLVGVGTAGLFGASLPVAGRLAKPLSDKVGDLAVRAGQGAYGQLPLGWRMGRAAEADLATMDDGALAQAFKQKVPEHLWTPDERSSVYVVEREGEVRAKSPFETTYEGYGAHGKRLADADSQLQGAVKPVAKPAPSAPGSFDMGRYMGRNRVAESGGNDAAAAQTSSAYGRYQFLKSTWLQTYKAEFGKTGETDLQILAKRADGATQDRLMARLTRDNVSAMERAGVPVTDGTVYLAHFLGQADAIKVLRAAPGTPVRGLVRGASIGANPGVFGKINTTGDLIRWSQRKMRQDPGAVPAGSGGAPDTGDAELARALEAERADIEAERARVTAENNGPRPFETARPAEPVPLLRREMFDDEASWRLAQSRIDSEAGGFEPVVTRQSLWEEARDRLMSERQGEVQGVLYHPDTGPIDVKWGNAQGGLAHIAAKHPEVLGNLPELIEAMGLKSRNDNRITLESLDHRAVVRLDWDGERQHWLLSAFKLGEGRKGKAPPPMVDSGTGSREARQDQSPSAGAGDEIGADGAQSKLPPDLAMIGKPWGYSEAGGLHSGFYRFETERGPITWDPVTGHANGAVPQRTGVTADDVRALVDPQGQLRQLVETAETAGLANDGRYADPGGAALALHSARLKHDMKLWADADERAFQLGEGEARTVKDVLDEMDGDEAAIAALKGCL